MEDKLASKQDLKELKSDMTIRMGTITATAVAIITAIQAWLMRH